SEESPQTPLVGSASSCGCWLASESSSCGGKSLPRTERISVPGQIKIRCAGSHRALLIACSTVELRRKAVQDRAASSRKCPQLLPEINRSCAATTFLTYS